MRARKVATLKAIPAPELAIHEAIVDALKVLLKPGILYWHTPNEGERDDAYAYRLKRMGVLAGVPDLLFIMPGGRVAFIEVKTPEGTLSLAQKAFRDSAIASGCQYAVAISVTDALRTLQEWGCLKPGVRP
jgi:hypothetical protein